RAACCWTARAARRHPSAAPTSSAGSWTACAPCDPGPGRVDLGVVTASAGIEAAATSRPTPSDRCRGSPPAAEPRPFPDPCPAPTWQGPVLPLFFRRAFPPTPAPCPPPLLPGGGPSLLRRC